MLERSALASILALATFAGRATIPWHVGGLVEMIVIAGGSSMSKSYCLATSIAIVASALARRPVED